MPISIDALALDLDLSRMPEALEVDLETAFLCLSMLYDQVDATLAKSTKDLDLPCKRGCSACCRESVFLTPLEFLYLWAWALGNLEQETLVEIVKKGLALYDENKAIIDALDAPPPEGEEDHFSLAKQLRYDCPLLGPAGECRAYPVRELYARLFGCSFDRKGGLYACEIIRQHLYGLPVTLLKAPDVARYLLDLPLTHKRQVFPSYFARFFGTFGFSDERVD